MHTIGSVAYRSSSARRIFRTALLGWLLLGVVVESIPAIGWPAKIVIFTVTFVPLVIWAFVIRVPSSKASDSTA
jgi:hypothetical protein